MPDFLQKAPPSAEPAKSGESPRVGADVPGTAPVAPVFQADKQKTPRSALPSVKPIVDTVRHKEDPSGGDGDESSDLKPHKAPSKIFVDYYAPVFLGMVSVFLLAGFFLLRPMIFEYRKLQGTIQGTVTMIGDERGYLESLDGSISAAKSIPPETLADVDEALPRDPGIPKLLEMMSVLAERNGVPLASVQFSSGKGDIAGGEVQSMNVSVSVAAKGYAGTRRLLDMFERNLRILDLDSITISGDSSTNEDGDSETSYNLLLRTYAMPEAPSPVHPTAAQP